MVQTPLPVLPALPQVNNLIPDIETKEVTQTQTAGTQTCTADSASDILLKNAQPNSNQSYVSTL